MSSSEYLAALPPAERRVFCNRTLNLRSIQAVGCDMDYTLVHYHSELWEQRAYEYVKEELLNRGFPVLHLEFQPVFVCRWFLFLCWDLELVFAFALVC
jgi:hypothetical protein